MAWRKVVEEIENDWKNATSLRRFWKACARSASTAPGKRTLKTVRVEPGPLPELTPDAIRRIREDLNLSRTVFAHMIRIPVRTVEGWEQGRSSPPGAATALILMAQKYPDTLERLASL